MTTLRQSPTLCFIFYSECTCNSVNSTSCFQQNFKNSQLYMSVCVRPTMELKGRPSVKRGVLKTHQLKQLFNLPPPPLTISYFSFLRSKKVKQMVLIKGLTQIKQRVNISPQNTYNQLGEWGLTENLIIKYMFYAFSERCEVPASQCRANKEL